MATGAQWKKSGAIASLKQQAAARVAPLKLGILCDGLTFEAWEAEAVTCLLASGFVELGLVILSGSMNDKNAMSRDQKLRRFMLKSFQRLTRARSHRRIDLSDTLSGVPIVRYMQNAQVEHAGVSNDVSVGTVRDVVADSSFDVILKLGSARVDIGLLAMPRHGVWAMNRTEQSAKAGGPPGFWEILNGDLVTGACLCRLTANEGEGVILRKGYLKTLGSLPGRSLDAISFECARWPTYAVAEIVNGTAELRTYGAIRAVAGQRVPTWFELARFFVKTARNFAGRMADYGAMDEWHVGVIKMPIRDIMEGKPLKEVQWLPSGANEWYADPFARLVGEKIAVLMEKMPLGRGRVETKAHIASVVLDESGWGVPEFAFATGSHVSYPYLIESEGRVFMTPETWELNELSLYEATEFPRTWRKVAVLLPGIAATDATVFEYRGRWWMLCTTSDASAETLLAFYADSLFGPWHGHRQNPLKVDVRGSRPAGRPFEIDGILYRPSQDCSRTYGGRIIVQRVLELDEQHWLEEQAFIFEPEPAWPYSEGLHTLSVVGDVCIIDAKRKSRRQGAALFRA